MIAYVLFYSFIAIFIATAIITLLGITGKIKVAKRYLNPLFTGLILEVVAAVVLLFRFSVLEPYELTAYKSFPSYESVEGFYTDIEKKEYSQAWNKLSPNSYHKRNMTMEDFKDGYKYNKRIHMIAIVPHKITGDSSHDYMVYYVDEVEAPVVTELDDLNKQRAHQLAQLPEKLNELKLRVEEAGFSANTIDQLTVSQLFPPNRGDVIRFLLRRDSDPKRNADYLFPERKLAKFVQGRLVVVENTGNDDWEILSFTPLEKAEF